MRTADIPTFCHNKLFWPWAAIWRSHVIHLFACFLPMLRWLPSLPKPHRHDICKPQRGPKSDLCTEASFTGLSAVENTMGFNSQVPTRRATPRLWRGCFGGRVRRHARARVWIWCISDRNGIRLSRRHPHGLLGVRGGESLLGRESGRSNSWASATFAVHPVWNQAIEVANVDCAVAVSLLRVPAWPSR